VGLDGLRQGFCLGIADYAHDFAECGVFPQRNVDAFTNGTLRWGTNWRANVWLMITTGGDRGVVKRQSDSVLE